MSEIPDNAFATEVTQDCGGAAQRMAHAPACPAVLAITFVMAIVADYVALTTSHRYVDYWAFSAETLAHAGLIITLAVLGSILCSIVAGVAGIVLLLRVPERPHNLVHTTTFDILVFGSIALDLFLLYLNCEALRFASDHGWLDTTWAE